MNEPKTNQIQYVSPTFKVHVFRATFMDKTILFQVVKMDESVLVFVNFIDLMRLTDMSLAMRSPYEKQPIGTQLLGDRPENVSKNIATRLCKKLNKSAYVSWNVDCEKQTLPLIEQRLYEEIKSFPDCF